MKTLIAAVALTVFTGGTAIAGDVPDFFKNTYPDYALGKAMELRSALGGEQSPLDAKTRQLISLGVAAQIPCQYCVYAHMHAARAAGATEAEIRAAVAQAADIRMWSTVLNGMAYDFDAFKAEYDKLMMSN